MEKQLARLFFATVLILSFSFMGAQAQTNIDGFVTYSNIDETPLAGVTVTLHDDLGNFVASQVTDSNGFFDFTNLNAGIYVLDASSTEEAGGITPTDAWMIWAHLRGMITLTPLQELAADVNFDNKINGHDMALIMLRYILNLQQFQPTEWVFEPITVDLQGNKTLTGGRTISGSSTGDVDGSYSPPQRKDDRPTIVLENNSELVAKTASTIRVPISFNDKLTLTSIGLVVDYPADLVEIVDVESDMGIQYNIINDQIRLAWADPEKMICQLDEGEEIAWIILRTKSSFTEGQKIEFTINRESELSDGNIKSIVNASVSIPSIEWSGMALKGIYPNPVIESTRIEFELEESANITISVVDLRGQKVAEVCQGYFAAGHYFKKFVPENLESGLYFLNMEIQSASGNFMETKKLILSH